jgi:hypothetical protein
MRTVEQIYKKYKIPLGIQLHQLRVAAVAKTICENRGNVDTKNVVTACIFHDMGNIIKAKLELFPEFLEPEGFEYWKSIKNEYIQKYGTDEHQATLAIGTELNLSEGIMALLRKIGFSNLDYADREGSMENKICSYADMRVGPHGVISIEERLTEARKRYAGTNHTVMGDRFESNAHHLRNIEKDIFSGIKIKPEEIIDEQITKNINSLKLLTLITRCMRGPCVRDEPHECNKDE